jgi:hypothetical protein
MIQATTSLTRAEGSGPDEFVRLPYAEIRQLVSDKP